MNQTPLFGVGLVIGGSGGVGAATVARLASRTATLLTTSRRPAVDGRNDNIHVHRLDVRRYEDFARLFAYLPGNVDYIVNCAGVGFYAPLTGDYTEAWREVLETNILGTANLLAAVNASGRTIGTIVTVLSLAAHQPSTTPGNTMYSAAKTAAQCLVDQFRTETRRDGRATRVVAISPGYISDTGFGQRFFDHAPTATVDLYAGRACLRPDDVAWLVETALLAPPGVELSQIIARPAPSGRQQG
ncbi:SDR family oxidoreductase [Nocardia gipuzkoensis]